jgi:hypothetical protein
MAKVEKKLEFSPVREVFGVNRQKNTLSYIERAIDGKFKNALQDGQYSAIVIYGTSKRASRRFAATCSQNTSAHSFRPPTG